MGGRQGLGTGKITKDSRWRITKNCLAEWVGAMYLLQFGSIVFSQAKIQHEGWGYLEDHGLVKGQAKLQSVRSLLTVFGQVCCVTWEFTVHTLLCR